MKTRTVLGVLVGTLVFLTLAETAHAQFYGRGGRGGWSGGFYGPGFGVGIGSRSYGGYYGGYGGYAGNYGGYYGSPHYGGGYAYPRYYGGPQGGYSSMYEPLYGGYPRMPALTESNPTQVRLRVLLPSSDARLWIQGVPMQVAGTERAFFSPALEPGKNYVYKLRATWMEGGREVSKDKEAVVIPGQETTVSFKETPGSDVERPMSEVKPEVRIPETKPPEEK